MGPVREVCPIGVRLHPVAVLVSENGFPPKSHGVKPNVPFSKCISLVTPFSDTEKIFSFTYDLHLHPHQLQEFIFLDHWAHKRLKKPLPAAPVGGAQWAGIGSMHP